MKTAKIQILLAALALAAPACSHKTGERAETPQTVDVALPEVDSVVIYHDYPGTLAAFSTADIVARVDGYITSMNYTGGDFVRRGDVLYTIEDRNYRDAVEEARSALATAESQAVYARDHYAALCRALESDAVSRMEVAQGRSAMETAEAAIQSARARLNTAQTQLGYCTVRAPFDGHVTINDYSVGAYVSGAGAPVKLATIYADARVLARFGIEDETYLGVIRSNIEQGHVDYTAMPVAFSDSLPHRYTANLDYMSPAIDTSTGTMTLEAVVENPYNELRAGMFVSISLPVGNEPHAILVKDISISSDQRGKYVYVVNDSNKVVYTPVQTGGLVRDSMRIITSGLDADSRYVTRALMRVRDGMTVEPHTVR